MMFITKFNNKCNSQTKKRQEMTKLLVVVLGLLIIKIVICKRKIPTSMPTPGITFNYIFNPYKLIDRQT